MTESPRGIPPLTEERRREPRQLTNLLLGIIAFALVLLLLVQARFVLISLAIAIILFSLTSEAINAIASGSRSGRCGCPTGWPHSRRWC